MEKLEIKTLDTYEDGKIISKYVEAETLEDKLIKTCKEQGIEEFIKQIEEYREFLKEKLEVTEEVEKNIFTKYKVECKEETLNKLTFVKNGLWDLIFKNCIIIDNEWYFYDQEWQEENVPVEYILYRAILYFHESKKYISDEEVFEKLNISEFVPIFNELDNKIQEKIRKQLVWNLHSKEEVEKDKYIKRFKEICNIDKEQENERLSYHLTEDEYFWCLCISKHYSRGIDAALAKFFGKHKSFLKNGQKSKTGKVKAALDRLAKLTSEESLIIAQQKFEEWAIQKYSNFQLNIKI